MKGTGNISDLNRHKTKCIINFFIKINRDLYNHEGHGPLLFLLLKTNI
jgi:hypothetical protein